MSGCGGGGGGGGGGTEVGITRHQQSIKGDYRNLTANQLEEELGSEQ